MVGLVSGVGVCELSERGRSFIGDVGRECCAGAEPTSFSDVLHALSLLRSGYFCGALRCNYGRARRWFEVVCCIAVSQNSVSISSLSNEPCSA